MFGKKFNASQIYVGTLGRMEDEYDNLINSIAIQGAENIDFQFRKEAI